MTKRKEIAGLLKYAMDAGRRQTASNGRKVSALKVASALLRRNERVDLRIKLANFYKKADGPDFMDAMGGPRTPPPTPPPAAAAAAAGAGAPPAMKPILNGAFQQPTASGFARTAVGAMPGWAKALALLGAAGVGGAAISHVGNQLMKRYDPGIDPEAKGIGMSHNLRSALTEQAAKGTAWASELGGIQHAFRNAYAPLYQ